MKIKKCKYANPDGTITCIVPYYTLCDICEHYLKFEQTPPKFMTVCTKCGSSNVSIEYDIEHDYDWDENCTSSISGAYHKCNNCGEDGL